MGIPNIYQTAGEGGLLNFNFSEVATGEGVVVFNSFATQSSGATIKHLNTPSSVSFKSTPQITTKECVDGSTDYLLAGSVSFDNAPNNYLTILDGRCFVDFTHGVGASGGVDAYSYVIAKVQVIDKNDVLVDTAGYAYSEIVTCGAGSTAFATRLLSFDLNKTNVRPTDYVRLVFDVYVKTTSGVATSGRGYILHDPSNSNVVSPAVTATTNHTYLKWYVSYRVDL